MRIFAGSGPRLACLFFMLASPPCRGFSDAAMEAGKEERRTLAVLDPIDLRTLKIDPEWGGFIRRSFAAGPGWKVIPRDTMVAKQKEYNLDSRTACHEFQCAFDAGNVFSAEFVLFGSLTATEELYAYTLNLVHVPTSQTVWSQVGDVRKRKIGSPSAALESNLAQLAAWLGPDKVRTGRRDKVGQLTVLDLGAAGSTPSRMLAERVATHVYASRNYDIMGKKEQDELLGALGIGKSGINPTDSAIYELGGKMGVSHLVYSRLLAVKQGGLQLQLALYDISERKKVRERPSPATRDFADLLRFEESFFSSLFRLPGYEGGAVAAGPGFRWKWAGAAAGLAFGSLCGYMAYASAREADRDYARFRQARAGETAQALRSQVEDADRGAWVWGGLGAAGLAGAGAFLVFSF